ncbi:MAG: type I secretion system permease/ATPase [Gammaproteobacteria bacterium]|nr:type I secretion system permease/ATPase [Gammaproteobacteria bacterium]
MTTIHSSNNTGHDPVGSAISDIKAYLGYATLFSACINFLMLTPIIYMLQVYDRVVSSGSMSTLLMLTLLMTALLGAAGGFEWVRSRILINANVRLEKDLRDAVARASFKHTLVSGNADEANLAMNDLVGLRQFLAGNGIFAFMDAPWTPIYIGVMFAFHSLFGYAAIVAALLMILLAVLTQKFTAKRLVKANALAARANGSFLSNLRNAEVIEGMGMASSIRSRNNQLFDLASTEQAIASGAAGILAAITKSFRMIVQSLLLGLGAYLALMQEISPGMMIAGSLLLGRALAPLDLMVSSWKSFITARSQFSRLQAGLKNLPPEVEPLRLPEPLGNLSVQQAIVIPPGAKIASVKGVSFSLSAGEVLGVVGPSAAGKTSLIRGILGIWPLRAGTIRLDGADITQWNRDELGPYLGYLPQDIELFEGTVSENIGRFALQNADKILHASKMAGIHGMILGLPNGYDTVIGPNSGALSAGQRQRLGLARALYGSPKLIVLDEPNSNLDELGERELQTSIKQVKEAGSTVIIVTHRTSVLSLADKILFIKEGIIQRFGERNQVLQALKDQSSKVAQLKPKV